MKTPAQDIILAPVITEASMAGIALKKYTFKVATNATKVVIMACSSRPARLSTWFRTATTIPMAAILKIRSTFT